MTPLIRRALAAILLAGLGTAGLVIAVRDEEAPTDRAAAFAPVGSRIYVNVALRSDGFHRLRALLPQLPAADAGTDEAIARLDALLGGPSLDPGRDIEPWLGDEAALAVTGGGRRPEWVAILEVARRDEAANRLAALAGSQFAFVRDGLRVEGTSRLVWTTTRGFALLGTPGAMRAAIDARGGAARALEDDAVYRVLRERLPGDRLATAYLSNAGLRRHAGPAATALAELSGARELRAAAAGLVLRHGRGRVTVATIPIARRPCGDPDRANVESLLDAAPQRAAGFLASATPRCIVADLGTSDTAVGRALRRLAREPRVALDRELRALLDRGAALLVLETDEGGPALVLLGEGGSRGVEALSRLQPAILRLLAPVRRGQAPAFEAVSLADGTPALTAELAPGLALSYADIRGRLAVSTSLEGLDAVASGGGLGDEERVARVIPRVGRNAASLVFLDLDQLLALAEQVGFAENTAYVAVRDDLQKLRSAGAVVTREGEYTTAELSFQIP